MKIYSDLFNKVIAAENLFAAWDEFRCGKSQKADVRAFERDLERHIFQLQRELTTHTYRHGAYYGFYISDPKLRHIHKAEVRDRIVHHALFRVLYGIFEPTFMADSFSCRLGKGSHKGVMRVQTMIRQVSANGSRPCYALKCDIKKFFDSVDHDILLTTLRRRIHDRQLMGLLTEIVGSYISSGTRERERERVKNTVRKGIPIGNLTSQIFANIYMNEFDQFIKHELKVKHYARYTDDFVILANSEAYLAGLLPSIEGFLEKRLRLRLHPEKVFIQPAQRGIDFLGYVIWWQHRLVRTKTRQRMVKKMVGRAREYEEGLREADSLHQSLQSYLGVLSHANARRLSNDLKNRFWVLKKD